MADGKTCEGTESLREKTNNLGFRSGSIQTGLFIIEAG